MNYNSVLSIDTQIIRNNLLSIMNSIGSDVSVIPVLKADAYGHGLPEIAKILCEDKRIQLLGIAQLSEGIALRSAGISCRIVVLCGMTKSQLNTAVQYDLEPIIHSADSLSDILDVFTALQLHEYPVHLKINSGLNRLGFIPGQELGIALDRIKKQSVFKIVSTYTHAVDGPVPYSKTAIAQYQVFEEALEQMKRADIDTGLRHFCDSGTSEWYSEAHYDAIRIGRALYMDNPSAVLNHGGHDAATWKCSIIAKRTLQAGEKLGYGFVYEATATTDIAIINVGYGDGMMPFTASMNAPILVGNQRASIIAVFMDQTFINVTGVDCKPNDEVTLFGTSETGTHLSSHEAAALFNDEGVTLTTMLSKRVLRIYK